MKTSIKRLFNNKSNILGENNYLYQVIRKYKFRVNTQPGLTRYQWDLETYKKYPYEESRLTHGTNAEELISNVPVIEVDDDVAMCMGVGELYYGHPVQWITLNTRNPEKPNICKYCGLRYVKKNHH